jgi:hypothetical protein
LVRTAGSWADFVSAFDALKASGGTIQLTANIIAPPGGQKTFAATTEGVEVQILTEGFLFRVTGSQITFGEGASFQGDSTGM